LLAGTIQNRSSLKQQVFKRKISQKIHLKFKDLISPSVYKWAEE